MPWYTWVFDGVGAAIVVPGIGWAIARCRPKRPTVPAEIESTTDAASKPIAQPITANSPATSLTSGPTRPPNAPEISPAPRQPIPTDLIDLLLAIPAMTDPAFRQRLYEHLPRDVAQQLHLDNRAARLELLGLIDTFAEYPHLAPWRSLLSRLEELLPAHPAVQVLGAELAQRGLA